MSAKSEGKNAVATRKKRTPARGNNGGRKSEDISAALSNISYWQGVRLVRSDVEVGERLAEFFERCEETGELPTVEKLSLALGTYSARVSKWEHGQSLMPNMTEATSEMIKKAKQYISAIDAELVSLGKMNTVAYIFRAKNFYGMRDQVDQVITHDNSTVQTTAELARKYGQGEVIDVEFKEKEKQEQK